ncbi:uncharacterized protein associated with GTPases [Bernardetia litoralis DSM 6794]|uniref:Uncharacterized protein associated with GTPases n=1 Tax=Bernardetia litoralis (strain ATCC 23117 / DSM 6794 / NBRC 15988 / NCIMB 1366 / Fx l1 / Sio-4) TaxID=880071 RepID=I4AG41_BERLS|nr:DUF697 domain-containing protein [Bernardetia litoralis]AFM02926.1 uncharacterized protein associated with GTPases [Bernardetia litoralis DSM 6794]
MWDYLLYKLKDKMRLDDDNERADKVVENSVVWAMSAALIPIPLADMIAVTVIQADMVRRLAEINGVEANNANIESWLGTLSGGVLSKLGAQALKLIPGWGSIAGGVGMAVLSGASTYAAGKTFAKHFKEGGDLEDFDADAVKEFYDEQLIKGRDFAKQMKDEVEKRAKKAYAEFSGEEVKQENEKDFEFEEVMDFEEVVDEKFQKEDKKQENSQKNTTTQNTKTTSASSEEPPHQANPNKHSAQKAPKTESTPPDSATNKNADVNSNTVNPSSYQSAKESANALAELRQLASLRDKGILTDEEFQRLKGKLMEKL